MALPRGGMGNSQTATPPHRHQTSRPNRPNRPNNPRRGRPPGRPGGPRDNPNEPQGLENTDVGNVLISQNHQDYYNALLARRNLMGENPFQQWMQSTGYDLTEADYFNTLTQGNGKTTFRDFMAGPVNTGNTMTSSSGVLGFKPWRAQNTNVTPRAFGQMAPNRRNMMKQRYQKWRQGQIEANAPGTPGTMTEADRFEMLRRKYLQLTPQQSGELQSGMGMRPARFSVYG